MESERTLILQMVADKKITVAEAIELMKALEPSRAATPEGILAKLQAPELPPVPQLPGMPSPPGAPFTHGSFGVPDDFAGKIGSLVESIIGNFGFGFGEGYKFEETFEGTFDESADSVLIDMLTQNGRIGIEAWDRPGYMVKLIKRVQAPSEQEARARSERWATVEREGNRLSVQMIPQGMGNQGMAIIAYLPKAKTYNVKLQTANGRIELDGLLTKTIYSRTANGLIRMDHMVADTVEARTSNGKILLRTSASQVQAHSSNGKVVIVPLAQTDTSLYDLRTSNGSIRVGAPTGGDVAFSVDLHVSNGRIEVESPDLQYEINEKYHGSRHVKARSGNFDTAAHKVSVTANTSNGSIVVGRVDWE